MSGQFTELKELLLLSPVVFNVKPFKGKVLAHALQAYCLLTLNTQDFLIISLVQSRQVFLLFVYNEQHGNTQSKHLKLCSAIQVFF